MIFLISLYYFWLACTEQLFSRLSSIGPVCLLPPVVEHDSCRQVISFGNVREFLAYCGFSHALSARRAYLDSTCCKDKAALWKEQLKTFGIDGRTADDMMRSRKCRKSARRIVLNIKPSARGNPSCGNKGSKARQKNSSEWHRYIYLLETIWQHLRHFASMKEYWWWLSEISKVRQKNSSENHAECRTNETSEKNK